jgi:hypothetical protein
MESAHSDQTPEPSTLQHVLTLLGIAVAIALIFYLSW